MPSFPSSNDPLDPFALLTCDRCGRDAFRLRPVQRGPFTLLYCDTCYGDGEAEQPTEPTLPAVQTGTVVDELHGCEHWPAPGVYCAAAYLAWQESRPTFIPDGEASLCLAHWRATFDDALQQFPSLLCQPWKTPHMAAWLGNIYIRAAEAITERIAARLESR